MLKQKVRNIVDGKKQNQKHEKTKRSDERRGIFLGDPQEHPSPLRGILSNNSTTYIR